MRTAGHIDAASQALLDAVACVRGHPALPDRPLLKFTSAERVEFVTVRRLRLSTFRFVAHLNMGRHGHAMLSECVDFPRLFLWRVSAGRTQSALPTFIVDGFKVADLVAAADALNRPPRQFPIKQLELGL